MVEAELGIYVGEGHLIRKQQVACSSGATNVVGIRGKSRRCLEKEIWYLGRPLSELRLVGMHRRDQLVGGTNPPAPKAGALPGCATPRHLLLP